ncbi:hypothetical protein CPB85DRAFT_1375422 [Mucidula mucida]|nr:hypothetical protein CPB85DRAFT_1375422 [Mucidula mucida]
MEMLLIAPFKNLLSHFRFLVTIRSQEGAYRGLILFRLSTNTLEWETASQEERESMYKQIYAMESSCPHLGADMSHADIEEHESNVVAVCPWHRYDFDLRTGKSETGLHACTFNIHVKADKNGVDNVYIEAPTCDSGWRVVELRPVSEEFADPPPTHSSQPPILAPASPVEAQNEPIVPDDPPKTLMDWAVLILNTPNPTLKVERTRHAVQLFRTGQLASIGHKSANHPPQPPDVPRREAIYQQNTVDPGKVKNRRNKAVMLHALANIEQWAWDIMARFGPMHPNLPPAFFSDFTKMALDESKHFSLLTSRLSAISPSTPYGSMPVHASLWESATITSNSFPRGLDVNPGTIERFRKAGDIESVKAMEIIHADEVTHVTAGHRWFTWICQQQGNLDPIKTFREEVRHGWRGDIKGPFNEEARDMAGLSKEFYEDLRGEMGIAPQQETAPIKVALPSVQIGY